jgi:protein-disulfide isomerase
MRERKTTLAGVALLAGAFLYAGSAAADSTEQVIKYYRKKANLPPTAKVQITGLKDSAIKGAKQGTMEIGEGPAAKKVNVLLSEDGKLAVFGDLEDVTVDPSKAVMAKINLKDEPFKGPADAKVTVVEFSDFQCPFCTKGYKTIEDQVLKEYDGKVKFYYKHYPLPFHPWATPAAIATECAQDLNKDAYWTLYKYYFDNQKDITPDNLKQKSTEQLQTVKGLDMAKWNECFDGKKTEARVKAEMAEGASVGVTGTPGFIVNGRLLVGAQPFEKFKDVIDDELASAK